MDPKSKYDDLHPKLRAFLEELDAKLAKCARPAYLYLRHGQLSPDRFEVVAKQGTDLTELNKQRAQLQMAALPRHANIPELAPDALASDHVSPCQAAKVVIHLTAGRAQVEPSQFKEWPKILAETLAAHPEIANPSTLYFRLVPKPAVKAKDESK